MAATQKQMAIGYESEAVRLITPAYGKLTRSLKCRPGQERRFIYDDVSKGRITRCVRELEAIDLAAQNGAGLDDLTALGCALIAYAEERHAFYNGTAPENMREVLRLEAHANAPTTEAAAEVMCDPKNLAAVERLVEVTRLEMNADEKVIKAGLRILAEAK